MTLLAYDPGLRLALADNADFPAREEDAHSACPDVQFALELDEWSPYFVKTYHDTVPSLLHDKRFARSLSSSLWEVNFRNFVGLSRIGAITLRVRNRKISDQLYKTLLDELADDHAALVFSYATPVGQQTHKTRPGTDNAMVENLFLCRYLLHDSPDLATIGEILTRDPHRAFARELLACPIEECRDGGIDVVQALITSPMAALDASHPLCATHLGQCLARRKKIS